MRSAASHHRKFDQISWLKGCGGAKQIFIPYPSPTQRPAAKGLVTLRISRLPKNRLPRCGILRWLANNTDAGRQQKREVRRLAWFAPTSGLSPEE